MKGNYFIFHLLPFFLIFFIVFHSHFNKSDRIAVKLANSKMLRLNLYFVNYIVH